MFIKDGPVVPGPWWIAHPNEIADTLDKWAKQYPRYVKLARKHTFRKHPVTAAIVTDYESGETERKRVLLAAVPHGHEPAGSAASMNFINGLLTGKDLLDQPFPIAGKDLLKDIVCVLIPAANADGFARSPILYWDGTRASDSFYHDVASGVLKNGQRFGRAVREWSERDHDIKSPGVHYEEIAQGEWVEPHINKKGTCWQLMRELFQEYPPDFFLNMHQGGNGRIYCGFGETPEPDPLAAHIKTPTDEWIPQKAQELSKRMAEKVWSAWDQNGIKNNHNLHGYTSKPASWRDGNQTRFKWMMDWVPESCGSGYLTLEVHVQNPRIPPKAQMAAGTLALVAVAQGLVGEPKIAHAFKE